MEYHDAANIFPMDETTIGDLAKDIREHGQQVPIEIFDGKILDGRRRWQACERAGVKPITKDVAPDDPVAYVLSLNLHRRHLSPTQLGMVGGRARKIYDEQAKARQIRKPGSVVENLPPQIDSGKARDAVGRVVGVSGKTIDHATRVLAKGSKKLIKAVDSDCMAVSTAARIINLPADEQDKIAERHLSGEAQVRPRPTEKSVDYPHPNGKPGVGVIRANEAINSLSRIPKNDPLRKRGFQIVTDWIRRNK